MTHLHKNLLWVGILKSALECSCNGTSHCGEHHHIIGTLLEYLTSCSSQHGGDVMISREVKRGRRRRRGRKERKRKMKEERGSCMLSPDGGAFCTGHSLAIVPFFFFSFLFFFFFFFLSAANPLAFSSLVGFCSAAASPRFPDPWQLLGFTAVDSAVHSDLSLGMAVFGTLYFFLSFSFPVSCGFNSSPRPVANWA